MTDDRFTLEVPADPAYVGTARMFASTLARHFEMPDELVEDLKLAISEACSRALASNAADRLSLLVERKDGRLLFEIEQADLSEPGSRDDTPTPSAHDLATGLGLELVTALFEDAEVAEADGGPVLRFSVG